MIQFGFNIIFAIIQVIWALQRSFSLFRINISEHINSIKSYLFCNKNMMYISYADNKFSREKSSIKI